MFMVMTLFSGPKIRTRSAFKELFCLFGGLLHVFLSTPLGCWRYSGVCHGPSFLLIH
jgi:hypothetical protein